MFVKVQYKLDPLKRGVEQGVCMHCKTRQWLELRRFEGKLYGAATVQIFDVLVCPKCGGLHQPLSTPLLSAGH
jgi:hypothetical protein